MSNVCMIAYSDYDQDARIKSYVRILRKAGHQVDLIALENGSGKRIEWLEGLTLHRVSGKYRGGVPLRYVASYLKFFLLAFLALNWLDLKRKFSVIHVHNMPNFLVFTAVVQRLFGKRVILDNHDVMIPLYEAKFRTEGRALALRVLRAEQTLSAAFSNAMICADHLQKEYLVQEFGIPREKITVVLNLPHEEIFRRIPVARENGVFKVVYHGTIAHRLGIDLMIEAMRRIKGRIPARLHIYGVGDFLDEVVALRNRYGLEEEVFIAGRAVPTESLSEILCGMDAGLIANRNTVSTNRYMFPVKLLEYVFLGLPVIVPRLDILRSYFDEDMLMFYEPEDVGEMAEKIVELYEDAARRRSIAERSYRFFERHSLDEKTRDYFAAIGATASTGESRPGGS